MTNKVGEDIAVIKVTLAQVARDIQELKSCTSDLTAFKWKVIGGSVVFSALFGWIFKKI